MNLTMENLDWPLESWRRINIFTNFVRSLSYWKLHFQFERGRQIICVYKSKHTPLLSPSLLPPIFYLLWYFPIVEVAQNYQVKKIFKISKCSRTAIFFQWVFQLISSIKHVKSNDRKTENTRKGEEINQQTKKKEKKSKIEDK